MTTAPVVLERAPRRAAAAAPARRRVRRFPVESSVIFALSLLLYLAAADFIVIHLHYNSGDSYSRVANAEYVIGSRDPHLAAVGFVWPPLTSLLDVPILLFQGWFPILRTEAFAGSVEAALFSAGTAVLLNIGMRWAGVLMPVRWLILLVWAANPMILLYGSIGMSEPLMVFFTVACLLLFLRWAETRRPALLAGLGCLAGAGMLVRNEFVAMAVVLGIGVGFCSWRRGGSWREVETKVLLYALPAAFALLLWIGSMWVIMRDPLYFVHSVYGNASDAAVSNHYDLQRFGYDLSSWTGDARFLLKQYVLLFPVIIPVVGLAVWRLVAGRERRSALVLLAMALPVPVVDMYLLHSQQLNVSLRYFIYVIPYTLVLAIAVIRSLHRHAPRVAAIAPVLLLPLLLLSNIMSLQLMSDPVASREEAVLVSAVEQGRALGSVDADFDPAEEGAYLANRVAALDPDHKLIGLDSFLGFPIIMNAPDPLTYVITSDEDFEASVNQPDVYHVAYFLVPQPRGVGTLDRLNVLYPTLWSNGGGFAQKVADIGGSFDWRLYRILRPTGRG